MAWKTATTGEFDEWFAELMEDVRIEVAAAIGVLARVGPILGRPLVDTLKSSKHSNMKELRVDECGQVIRIAFAFDPQRSAILLVGGAKQGTNPRLFYKQLIRKADRLYDAHLQRISQRSAQGR